MILKVAMENVRGQVKALPREKLEEFFMTIATMVCDHDGQADEENGLYNPAITYEMSDEEACSFAQAVCQNVEGYVALPENDIEFSDEEGDDEDSEGD